MLREIAPDIEAQMHPQNLPEATPVPDVPPQKLKVLCIGGTGQNGATLLSRMLSQVRGVVAVGEIGFLWDRALIGGQPCGCGAPFRECEFWSAVGDEAFGGWDAIDPAEVARLRDHILLRRRHLSLPLAFPYMVRPSLSPAYLDTVLRYGRLMLRVFEGIRAVSGAQVIVDSTKVPGHLYMLRHIPELDQRVIHLVRDSRGVAHSNLKVVPRQASVDGRTHRGRHAPTRTAARWVWINLALDALGPVGVPTTFVRYESMVRHPRDHLTRVLRFTGHDVGWQDLRFIRGQEVDLAEDHLMAGNRMRAHLGPLRLRVDDGWRTNLPRKDRRAVYLMTWPLLRRYRG